MRRWGPLRVYLLCGSRIVPAVDVLLDSRQLCVPKRERLSRPGTRRIKRDGSRLLSRLTKGFGQVSTRPLRILITLGDLRDNGGMRSTVELVRQWNAAGASARLFALQPSPERPGDVQGVPVAAGTERTGRLRYAFPTVVTRLWHECLRADVVASASETGLGLMVTFLCARLARRPFVVFVRADPQRSMKDFLPRCWHPAVRLALGAADALICIAADLLPAANALRGRRGGVHVIRDGLDAHRVRALATSAEPRFCEPGLPTVVSAGRLTRQKGYDVLMEAHRRLLARGYLHRVLVLGDGPLRDGLLNQAAELGVASTFQLPGHADNPFPDIAAADLFCMPSRYEGLCGIVLEVLALAVPVVATTASQEPLGDGKLGDVVPPDDPDALATAIARHLTDPTRLRRLASAGPDFVLQFDWTESAAGCINVFEQIVSQQRRRASDRSPATGTAA